MNVFSVFLFLIGVTYSIFTILAGTVQLKQKKINIWASLSMIIGGLLILVSIALNLAMKTNVIYILIIGLILIHISAINNGYKMYGKINPKHHMVRLCISIVIIILYEFSI